MLARLETSYQGEGNAGTLWSKHDVQRPDRSIWAPLANRHDRIAARLPLRFLAPHKLRLPSTLGGIIPYECILGAVSVQEILTLTLLRQMYSVA